MTESGSTAGGQRKKLHGKVAIVTGGASGIGEATARRFADHGALAVVIADIQDDLGRRVADSLGPHRSTYVRCDVSDEDQVRAAVDLAVERYGRLDIMFSNAGIICLGAAPEQTVLGLDLAALDRVMAVNARGAAACVKQAARAMVERRVRGSIVCTASVCGSRGAVRATDYVMSKHAVVGLVKSASQQLGGHGIRVNCVSPYAVATPGLCRANKMAAEEVEGSHRPRTCLKGLTLKAEHVADAVVFLASDDAEFVTGHDLVVDGGFSLLSGAPPPPRAPPAEN